MVEDRKTALVMADDDEGRWRIGVIVLAMANGEDGRSDIMMGEDGDGSRRSVDGTRIRDRTRTEDQLQWKNCRLKKSGDRLRREEEELKRRGDGLLPFSRLHIRFGHF